MAKGSRNAKKSLPKHAHCRVSFLHQAATHIATWEALHHAIWTRASGTHTDPARVESRAGSRQTISHRFFQQHSALQDGLSRHFITNLKGIALRAQIRQSKELKHTICKSCDGLLFPNLRTIARIENLSKKNHKPWADVLIIQCDCGAQSRYPIGATYQKRV